MVGLVGVLLIELVLRPLNEDLSRATEGLTLVVPVIVAAVMGGQRARVRHGGERRTWPTRC